MAKIRSLRPRNADDLGLRRERTDRLVPLLVAAMSFLAALALAGAIAGSALAAQWRAGRAASVVVQVPEPDAASGMATRADAVAAILAATPWIAGARRLSDQELATLLRPWLGEDPAALSLKLPALFELTLAAGGDMPGLAARLSQAAPGTLLDRDAAWMDRLHALIRSIEACATLAFLLVAVTASAMVAIATRAGLAARRETIEIVHGLGATDSTIAARFAGRIGRLALAGGMLGVMPAIPVLLGLASLAAPFGRGASTPGVLDRLPSALWIALPGLPLGALLIGWGTAQVTVRLWLARLP